MTKVLFHFVTTNGQPIPFADVEIQLTRSDFDEAVSGVILPRLIKVVTDVDGKVLQELAPCDTRYHVTVYDTVSDVGIHHHFYVPVVEDVNTILNFQDLIVPDDTVMSSLPYDEVALAAIMAARLDTLAARDVALASVGSIDDSVLAAETAASIAVDAKGVVINARDQAQIYMQVAMDSSDNAETMAGNAEVSAAAALISQGLADADAAAALVSQNAAAASAVVAAARADDTLANKTIVLAAKDVVLASETSAIGAKTAAETARDAAAGSAATASTKAGEAAQSAVNAAASAATAAAAQIQSDWTQGNNALKDFIKNKPVLAPVATSGSKADVGLGNVDNTSDANKPVSFAQQTALDLKASITYVDGKIAALVASSPAALDTLNELAAALGNDANFAATTATSLGNRLRVDAAQGLTAPQKAQGVSNLGLAAVAVSGAKADVGLGNVDNTSDANKPVSSAQATAIGLKIDTAAKDATGGVPGLTAFAINMRNALNTFTSLLSNANTAVRNYVFPDKSGIVALTQDLPGRNRFINGDMRIDQRFAGTALTCPVNTANYTVDQWLMLNARTNGTTVVAQRDTADVPAGFAYCLKLTNTSTGAAAAGDSIHIGQALEGLNVADLDYGKATAKTVTIQFWAKASAGGNYAVGLRNANSTRSYIQHVALTANTWTYVSLTIPGDTTGTWLTDTSVGIYFVIDLGMGSTYNTATLGAWQAGSFLGTTTSVKPFLTAGATFRLTGAQFEANSLATPFEVRNFGDELMRCQRYYCKTVPYNVVMQNNPTSGAGGGALFLGGNGTAAYHTVRWEFPVQMRVAPTVTTYNVTTGTAGYWRDVASSTDVAAGFISTSDKSVHVCLNNASTYTPAATSAWYINAAASAVM